MSEKFPFDPPPGIFPGENRFGLDNRYWDCSNVRFRKGKAEVIGGWTGSTSLVSGTCRAIFSWSSLSGTARYAYGTTTSLYEGISGANNITPVGLPVSTGHWSLQAYGENLLAAQAAGSLYQWTGAGVATIIATAPATITAMLVTNERQVMAFGCNEETSGTFNGMCVRWSDIEDPTDWTTSPTNNAGEQILDGSGKIISAFKIGSVIGILTDRSLYVVQFIGDPGQTFRFDKVGDNCGCLGLRAVTTAAGVAYWITNDYQIYSWVPGDIPRPMECSVLSVFQNTVNDNKSAAVVRRSFAAYNSKFNEVWFFYPTGSSSAAEPSAYIAVGLDDGAWFRGSLVATAMYQTELSLLSVDTARIIYTHETTNKGMPSRPLTWSLTSAYYYLSEGKYRYQLQCMWPNFGDSNTFRKGTVTATISGQSYPQGGPALSGTSKVLTVGVNDYKKDFRLSGKLVSLTLTGTDSSGTVETFMRMGKLEFDAVQMGER